MEFVTLRTAYDGKTDTIYYTGLVRGGMYKDVIEVGYTEFDYLFLKINAYGELFADRRAYKVGKFEVDDKVRLKMGGDVVNGSKKKYLCRTFNSVK